MRAVAPQLARLDDTPFTVERLVDRGGRQWVEHSYPGRDGVELEDMGRLPERYEVEGHFRGPQFIIGLSFLKLSAEADRVVDFIHPFWGIRRGVIRDLVVAHQDRKHDFARVTFGFTVGIEAPLAFTVGSSAVAAAAAVDAANARLFASVAAMIARTQ